MDVLSQAVIGSSLSQSFTKNKQRYAMLVGSLSAVSPDLDVFISSSTDPILFLEYHRQFTHSFLFIPLAAVLCASIFYMFLKHKLSFKQIYVFSVLGILTHGLLDACTSYGTQLLWPFSAERISWNIISIVDPLFTFPILIGIGLGAYFKRQLYSRITFIYAFLYLSLGFVQKERAISALKIIAEERSHRVERYQVKPSFGNRHLWKLIYEYDNHYYVNAVQLLWTPHVFEGDSIKKLTIQSDYPWLDKNSQQSKDVERFRIFSGDFLAVDPIDSNIIIDMRYSFLPNKIKLMWGIKLNPEQGSSDKHVEYVVDSKMDKATREAFIEMLF